MRRNSCWSPASKARGDRHQPDDQPRDRRTTRMIRVQCLGEEHAQGDKRRVDALLNVTPAEASAELTIVASRISEKGRTFKHSTAGAI